MRILALFVFALVFAAARPARAVPPGAPLESISWLLGRWERTDLPAGQSGEEQWRREGARLQGRGLARRGEDTVFEEQLSIEAEGTALFYVAEVSGAPAPVRFRSVEQGEDRIAFENPAHDFPQRIAYRREGERLYAEVSGPGRVARFAFRRVGL